MQNGTWEINTERTTLSLVLNIPNPVGDGTVAAPLTITDLQESTVQVSGSTKIPLPADFFALLGVDTTKYNITVIQTMMSITITRMP